jgi:hypothetical protein
MNRTIAGFLAVLVIATVCEVGARASFGPSPGARQAVPVAPRNLQVLTELRGQPASAVYDAMDFIAGSLGVSCDTCHVPPFDSDVKPAKATARTMIKMVRAINDANFGGRPVVTCETCHHGHLKPDNAPSPVYATPEQMAAARQSAADQSAGVTPPPRPAPVSLPSVDAVLANYRRAVGATALTSLRITGTSADKFNTNQIELIVLYPDQARLTTTGGAGQTIQQIANHDHGWVAAPGSRVPMPPWQLARFTNAVKTWAFLPAALMSRQATVSGVARVGSRDCYVVQSDTPSGVERLYIDQESWLLLKLRREITTALGTAVHEIEWTDYRDVNGVKRPTRMFDHLLGNEVDYTFTNFQTDVPVAPAIFEPPPAKEHIAVTLPPAALDAVAGSYQAAPGNVFTFVHEGAQLFVTQPSGLRLEVFAESTTEFFLKEAPVQFTFAKGPGGEVTTMIIHQAGATRECPRVK